MPKGGSVNQIEPSDVTTTSLGELSRLPAKPSHSTVSVPSGSVRVTRLAPCSQVTRRPWRSRVLPLAVLDGLRKTLTAPVSSSHFMMRSFGMSLHSRWRPSPNQAGPSHQRNPVASRSTAALKMRYLAKLGSRIWIALRRRPARPARPRARDDAGLQPFRRLGEAVRDVVDGIEARHVLLLQEIDGVALALGEHGDEHVGARHLLAAGGLDVDD